MKHDFEQKLQLPEHSQWLLSSVLVSKTDKKRKTLDAREWQEKPMHANFSDGTLDQP
jgi:hypothetical protein